MICYGLNGKLCPLQRQNCIIVNDDQQDATILVYLFIPNQLYMFRAVFAHNQEHLTVFTASDIVHLYCCRLLSWMS